MGLEITKNFLSDSIFPPQKRYLHALHHFLTNTNSQKRDFLSEFKILSLINQGRYGVILKCEEKKVDKLISKHTLENKENVNIELNKYSAIKIVKIKFEEDDRLQVVPKGYKPSGDEDEQVLVLGKKRVTMEIRKKQDPPKSSNDGQTNTSNPTTNDSVEKKKKNSEKKKKRLSEDIDLEAEIKKEVKQISEDRSKRTASARMREFSIREERKKYEDRRKKMMNLSVCNFTSIAEVLNKCSDITTKEEMSNKKISLLETSLPRILHELTCLYKVKGNENFVQIEDFWLQEVPSGALKKNIFSRGVSKEILGKKKSEIFVFMKFKLYTSDLFEFDEDVMFDTVLRRVKNDERKARLLSSSVSVDGDVEKKKSVEISVEKKKLIRRYNCEYNEEIMFQIMCLIDMYFGLKKLNIVHFDIRLVNVFVDFNKNEEGASCKYVLGDFGLALNLDNKIFYKMYDRMHDMNILYEKVGRDFDKERLEDVLEMLMGKMETEEVIENDKKLGVRDLPNDDMLVLIAFQNVVKGFIESDESWEKLFVSYSRYKKKFAKIVQEKRIRKQINELEKN